MPSGGCFPLVFPFRVGLFAHIYVSTLSLWSSLRLPSQIERASPLPRFFALIPAHWRKYPAYVCCTRLCTAKIHLLNLEREMMMLLFFFLVMFVYLCACGFAGRIYRYRSSQEFIFDGQYEALLLLSTSCKIFFLKAKTKNKIKKKEHNS